MMAEGSSDDIHDDLSEFQDENEDVKRIKEEWQRLHRQGAEESRRRIQEEVERQKASWETNADGTVTDDKKPPARLPSLGAMPIDNPALNKKLPRLGSLGHRLGIMVDGNELEPDRLQPEKTSYYFGVDTPTQTEIRWSPPGNASKFSALTYNIEVDGGQGWTALTDSRQPLLRVYFTSEKIIVGRFTKAQEAEPVAVRLHIRATGTVKAQGQEENISGPWSDDIWLSLEGSCVTQNTAV